MTMSSDKNVGKKDDHDGASATTMAMTTRTTTTTTTIERESFATHLERQESLTFLRPEFRTSDPNPDSDKSVLLKGSPLPRNSSFDDTIFNSKESFSSLFQSEEWLPPRNDYQSVSMPTKDETNLKPDYMPHSETSPQLEGNAVTILGSNRVTAKDWQQLSDFLSVQVDNNTGDRCQHGHPKLSNLSNPIPQAPATIMAFPITIPPIQAEPDDGEADQSKPPARTQQVMNSLQFAEQRLGRSAPHTNIEVMNGPQELQNLIFENPSSRWVPPPQSLQQRDQTVHVATSAASAPSVASAVPAAPLPPAQAKKPGEKPCENTKKRKRRPRRKILPAVKTYVETEKNDVLGGRGGRSNHHPGNKKYREEVNKLQATYRAASDEEKTRLSQKVVETVKNYGGRFLEKDSEGWFVVPDIVARRKASQALREDNDAEKRAMKRARFLTRRLQQQESNKKDSEDSDGGGSEEYGRESDAK